MLHAIEEGWSALRKPETDVGVRNTRPRRTGISAGITGPRYAMALSLYFGLPMNPHLAPLVRSRFAIYALTMIPACSSPDPNEDGALGSGGAPVASGGAASGSTSGSGGLPSSGGASTGGDSGADSGGTWGSGGADSTSGGVANGSGGASGGSAPGTGGAASGGDSGSGGNTASTGGTSGGCQSADILCEQFESYSGARPSGGIWKADPCSNTGYMASTDAGTGPDGSAAYVTKGASTGTNYCALMGDLGDGLTDFWVSAAIKIGGTNPDMEHELTFFELGALESDDPELRVGYRGDSSCAVQGFELGATQGPGGEYTGCTGTKPVANQWYCLEVHVDQSGGSIVSQLYVDGEKQDYNVHGMTEQDVLGTFKARYLKVGLQSYGGEFESLTLDNLSVSTSRVGCD